MLKRTFGSKRKKVIGGWIKLHKKGIHNLISSPNINSDQIKEDKMGRARSTHGSKKCIQSFGPKT
jgi:hypothetical protein